MTYAILSSVLSDHPVPYIVCECGDGGVVMMGGGEEGVGGVKTPQGPVLEGNE